MTIRPFSFDIRPLRQCLAVRDLRSGIAGPLAQGSGIAGPLAQGSGIAGPLAQGSGIAGPLAM